MHAQSGFAHDFAAETQFLKIDSMRFIFFKLIEHGDGTPPAEKSRKFAECGYEVGRDARARRCFGIIVDENCRCSFGEGAEKDIGIGSHGNDALARRQFFRSCGADAERFNGELKARVPVEFLENSIEERLPESREIGSAVSAVHEPDSFFGHENACFASVGNLNDPQLVEVGERLRDGMFADSVSRAELFYGRQS